MAYIYRMVQLRLSKYPLAKRYFFEGLDDAKKKRSKIGLAINYLGLSKTYAKLELPDSAYFYAVESLSLLKGLKEIRILDIDLVTGYENLYQHFIQFEQRDSAFKYLQFAYAEKAAFTKSKHTTGHL